VEPTLVVAGPPALTIRTESDTALESARKQRMRSWLFCVVFVVGDLFVTVLAVSAQRPWEPACTSRYKGRRPDPKVIAAILADHEAWLKDLEQGKVKGDTPDERRANLCGTHLNRANFKKVNLSEANLQKANLVEANLQKANLQKANLQEANLVGANLEKANLMEANLQKASLFMANLQEAQLSVANLHKVDLRWAKLRKADLTGANLQEANLMRANFQEADLYGANLQEANVWWTDFSQADLSLANLRATMFEPRPGAFPSMDSILLIETEGLEEIKFSREPHALVAMREAFKKAGMREQERKLTYAIERGKRELAWRKPFGADKIETGLKYILFEATCHYGLFPGQPLRLLSGFLVVFSIPYLFALKARGRAGIWAIWSPDRVHKTEGQETPVRVTDEFSFSRWTGTRWETLARWIRAFGVALYFSFLSAVHIGWRDLNVGTWITRMQPREYTLRATGWVRTVSGLQSLLSVYLIALSVLTYFGRLFE
jgi:Pentapeptide repeats (8 copies)